MPINVAPSPHLSNTDLTTRRMMIDVLLALAPAMVVAVLIFSWYAVAVVGICVLSCLAAEVLFNYMRKRPLSITDGSGAVTGIILGLSLPWSTPWYIAVIGSFTAIGIGKMAFGGLGQNLFNPAMVGRAFVMLSFARALGAPAYVDPNAAMEVVTQATPLTAAKGTSVALGWDALWPMFLGTVNGSLGETSALAILVGGLYLCVRRTAAWRIPAGMLGAAFVAAGISHALGLTPLTANHHLFAGSLLFGAFFIATDPCSSPVTPRGQWIFGIGIGLIVIALRVFSSYPAGVMFAVLLMNAATPLLNRWTVPRPLGGPTPKPKAA